MTHTCTHREEEKNKWKRLYRVSHTHLCAFDDADKRETDCCCCCCCRRRCCWRNIHAHFQLKIQHTKVHTQRDRAVCACVCNVHDPRRCCYCCCKHFSMLILCMLPLLLLLLGLFLSGHIGKRWVSECAFVSERASVCAYECVWHQKRNAAFLCTECGHKSQCTV